MISRLFALDQGFPQPIVDALHEYLKSDANLVPLATIDGRLTDMEDWEILLALHHDADAWDGLISTDTGMLALPRELAALMQTKLTLVVCRAAGHDPVRATGLLLTNLGTICDQTRSAVAQVWDLGGGRRREARNPWDYFARAADKRNMTLASCAGRNGSPARNSLRIHWGEPSYPARSLSFYSRHGRQPAPHLHRR